MATMSDLPGDLVGEIFARVPLTSLKAVRSICKKWNTLTKSQIIGKAANNQILGFVLMDSRVFSVKFDDDSVDPSIKEISKLKQDKIFTVFHCNGLLLCVLKDQSWLLVWNPYLGKIGWIHSRKNHSKADMYALGYDNNNNRNQKILRINNVSFAYEIYDFSSNSWRVLDVVPDFYIDYENGVSLKGNTYFFAEDKLTEDGEIGDFLICFDFTAERIGPPLRLPIDSNGSDAINLSCVRDEQLALLCLRCYKNFETMEIWVSTKIEHNAVSWSTFLKVNMIGLNGFPAAHFNRRSFFIDEENKIVVASDVNFDEPTQTWLLTVYVIGEDRSFKSVNTGEASRYFPLDLVLSSYVPSLVQLQIEKQRKRKRR